jgi:hypothetical protein
MQPCRAWVLELERTNEQGKEEHHLGPRICPAPVPQLELDWRRSSILVNKGALARSSLVLSEASAGLYIAPDTTI